MKKKHARKLKRAPRHRNAASAAPAPRSRGRTSSGERPPRASRSAPPDWKTIAAAVAGGAGSAALGGLVVNQQILSSEAVGIGLMLGGGATAYFSEGLPRIVGTSIAAAGAGQFALTMLNKRAVHAHGKANAAAPSPAPAPTAQLAPPPAVAPRESATGGGVVVDLFRDAANDLAMLEDEWRYGIRDDAHASDGGPVVIDLDDAA
jgi:hypothetical protein